VGGRAADHADGGAPPHAADALDFAHRLQGVAMAARIGHTDTARASMVATTTRQLSAELAADLEERLAGPA
jgi:hypothetical protein